MSAFEAYSAERAVEIISANVDREGALLPVLHALQHAFGHIPDACVRVVAGALNLSRAEVHGVVTFYHDFKLQPGARRTLKLCRAEACQARGGDAIVALAETKLGLRMGETSENGEVALEEIFCLGLCASGPSAMLGERLVARLDEARLDALIAEARA
jgi:formate dehydrogenase subunit gamma